MQCRLRLHLRAQAIELGHLSMQVAVSDRRQQFEAWNVGFRNHIGPFDLGFHSSCNNDYYNIKESPDQNQYNSPGLYHHTSQNWNYWLHARPVGEGGGGYSRFKVTGMIKWGQKSQHQKIPRASNKTPQTYLDQNPTPKSKISHPKDFFNHPFHLKPRPSPPMHGNNSSHAQGPTPSRTWQVRGPFCKL